jgi:hypothetical protein
MLVRGRTARHRNRRAPRTFVAATVVCLVMLALLAVVQVAHVHPLETDADHCPLCIAIHAVAPVALTSAVVILVQVGTPVPVLEPRSILRHWHPILFTRPPPAAL